VDILQLMSDLLFDYTLRTVALGSAMLGIVSGGLGTFAVLRKQSLLGDAISHAALPGIALAFLLTGSKELIVLILGAIAAGWIGTIAIMNIVGKTRIKYDSALGIVLSVFFGFGLVMLTFIQKLPTATQAGLDKFLFGQAAALLQRDIITMAVLGGIALTLTAVFWKEFKLLSFDPDFGASLGFSIKALDVFLTTLLVVAIVIGLQTVGVVLMSAMVVAPAAAARQWTDRLSWMVVLSALFGAVAGVVGAVLSSTVLNLSTGPMIVLCVSGIVIVSLTLAPNRGLLWSWYRRHRNRQRLHLEAVLGDLYLLARQHEDVFHPHPIAVLRTMSVRRGGVERSLQALADLGWVRCLDDDRWALTDSGFRHAERSIIGQKGK
jgi:manganese/zinc/iron transport system permease protein